MAEKTLTFVQFDCLVNSMRNPHLKHDISTFIFCNFEDMYQYVMFDTPKIAEYCMQNINNSVLIQPNVLKICTLSLHDTQHIFE